MAYTKIWTLLNTEQFHWIGLLVVSDFQKLLYLVSTEDAMTIKPLRDFGIEKAIKWTEVIIYNYFELCKEISIEKH